MSTVLNAEIPAEASAAIESAPTPQAPSTFAEEMNSWTPEQRKIWDETGAEPTKPAPAEAPAETTEKQVEPPVPKGKTEAATETAEEDQELPEGDTVEDRRKRNKMFAAMRVKQAALKAENELLKNQRMEIPARTTESAPAPKVESKADTATKLPNMHDYDGSPGKTYEDFQNDTSAAIIAIAEERAFARLKGERETETAKERETRIQSDWDKGQSALLAKAEGEDIDAHRLRNLQYANASRWVVSQIKAVGAAHIEQALMESPEIGPKLILHFGSEANRGQFAEILAMSPHRALLALGKAGTKFDPSEKTLTPKPITVTRAGAPAERVDASGSPAKDPIAEASRMYDKTGDHKYLKLMNDLSDKRDAEARNRR